MSYKWGEVKVPRESHRKGTSEHKGRDGASAVISQGTPQIASKHQMLEEARKDHPLVPSDTAWSSDTWFETPSLQEQKEDTFVVVNHLACDCLTW